MIYVTMLLCASLLMSFAYRYDMYDREPWYMLVLAIVLWMVSCWGVGYFEDAVQVSLGETGMSIAGQSVIAAVAEEGSKLLVVVLIAICFPKQFDDPMDGIIYGAFAGLGFAICESIFYIDLAQHAHPTPTHVQLFGQESIRLILHFLTGGMNGFGIGLFKFKVGKWKIILPTWISAAIGIHFLWDFSCGLRGDADSPELFRRSIAIGLMLFATFLFGVAVYVGVSWSRLHHPAAESKHQLFGWPFSLLLRRDK